MFNECEPLICIKVKSSNESEEETNNGFIYPVFFDDEYWRVVPQKTFPNNDLLIVYPNYKKNVYFSDVVDHFENMELFSVSYFSEVNLIDESKPNLSKYCVYTNSISDYKVRKKYRNCFILDALNIDTAIVRCFSPFKPIDNFYFIRNSGFIYGPFKVVSQEKNTNGTYGYYVNLAAEERLLPFVSNKNYNNYFVYKIKEELCQEDIVSSEISFNDVKMRNEWNGERFSYVRDVFSLIEKEKGIWVDFIPDDALLSWGINLVQNKVSQSISFNQRRELLEQLRRVNDADKNRLSKIVSKLSSIEKDEHDLNEQIFNYVCKKENIKYLLNTAEAEFINVINSDNTLKQKFGGDDKKKIKELEEELNKKEMVGDVSKSLSEVQKLLDITKQELSEKQKKVEELNIKISFTNIKDEYGKLQKELKKIKLELEEKNSELERLEDIKNKISQEIPKVKKEYREEIYKLAPIVKMLTEADYINERYEDTYDTNKGQNLSLQEIVNQVYTYFEKQNRLLQRKDIINYLVSLVNNFFLIFYGKPGVGKTSLVQNLASSLGANFNKISVNKGWSSSKDLIGYYNSLTGHFVEADTGLRTFLKKQQSDKNKGCLYLSLLDEANLSPIEYYWSNFLSIADDENKFIRLQSERELEEIQILDSMKFIATINMDDTTEILSPRIINRACVFYLPNNDLKQVEDNKTQTVVPISYTALENNFGFRQVAKNLAAESYGNDKLETIYDILSKNRNGRFISPRKQKNIRKYIDVMTSIGEQNDNFEYDNSDVLDYAIAQFILPEICGDGEKYLSILKMLYDELSSYTISKNIVQNIIEVGEYNYGNYNFFNI